MLKKIALALAIAALSLTSDQTHARNDCYAWSQARSIISSENLMSARDVTVAVKKRYGGKLLGAKLCERNGRFVYDVTILREGGQVTEVTVNGRTGAHISAIGAGGAAAASASGGSSYKKNGGFQFKLPKFWKKND